MSGIKPVGRHADTRLSAAFVRSQTTAGFYADGHGLYLKVDDNGSKRWVQRLIIQGKRRDLGLGSALLVPLAEAREQALENRKAARAGSDPIAEKRRQQGILSFEEAARDVHKLNEPTWRNAKHGAQWISTLEAYVFPTLGKKAMNRIDSDDVLSVLKPIWNSHPETARRVKQRIGTVLQWGIAKGWRSDNPAAAITKVLPKHDRSKIVHRKALPYQGVGKAIKAVQASEALQASKLAFEFLILTATRSGETREARWNEIDLEKAIWTIPASRMKAKRPHRVPLSPRALAILESAKTLPGGGVELVFPGASEKKTLSDASLSKLLRELKIEAVPHGFRSSFRDWASEQTSYPREVAEAALAHVIKDKAEAAYARSDLFEKRKDMMFDWSEYVKS